MTAFGEMAIISLILTVILDREVGESEKAGDDEHDADQQRALGVGGHPVAQAVENKLSATSLILR